MAIKNAYLRKSIGVLGAMALKIWRGTLDCKAIYWEPTVDTVHPRHSGCFVYAGWHDVMLMPIILRGHKRMLALASQHGDGDIISSAMTHLGWSMVRGSSSHGSVSALLEMMRAGDRHLNITPDGPRGPRHTMSAGAIFLASKLGRPLVCVGYAFDRPWRMRSWDRFAAPRPYSRARAVFGPPLRIPARVDRPTLERYRKWFEDLLNFLTDEADTWAESGEHRVGELPMWVGRAPSTMLSWQPAHAPRLPDRLHHEWIALGNPPISTGLAPVPSQAA